MLIDKQKAGEQLHLKLTNSADTAAAVIRAIMPE